MGPLAGFALRCLREPRLAFPPPGRYVSSRTASSRSAFRDDSFKCLADEVTNMLQSLASSVPELDFIHT